MLMFMDEVSNQMVRVNEVEKENESYRSALSCDVVYLLIVNIRKVGIFFKNVSTFGSVNVERRSSVKGIARGV